MSDIACPAANWQSKDIKNDKFNPTRRLHMILLIRWAARSPWPRARRTGVLTMSVAFAKAWATCRTPYLCCPDSLSDVRPPQFDSSTYQPDIEGYDNYYQR